MREVLILLSIVLLLAGCSPGGQTIRVTDATKPVTLDLHAPPEIGHPRSLSFTAGGRVSGSGYLWGDGIRTQAFAGSFHIRVRTSVSSNAVVLHYVPNEVSSGGFSLSYEFGGE